MLTLTPLFSFSRLCVLSFLLLFPSISLAENPVVSATADIITAQLNEVEASTELDEVLKSTLTQYYRKSLSHLEKERVSLQAGKSFSSALKKTPSELKVARKALETLKQKDLAVTLKVFESSPIADIEQALLNEKVYQAKVSIKLNEIEKQLAMEAKRPTAIRERINSIRNRQEVIDNELEQVVSADELPRLSEAKRWSLTTEQQALRAELKMLDQELLSQPIRVNLLRILQEKAELSFNQLNERIKLLEELLSQQRQSEAEQARTEAEVTRSETADKHPLIQALAQKNAELSDYLTTLSVELGNVTIAGQEALEAAKRTEDELRRIREKIEVAGLSQSFGQILFEQRRLLPDERKIRKEAQAREELIAAAGLKQIQDNEELRRLRSISGYVEQLTSGLREDEIVLIRGDLEELVEKRRELLGKESSQNEAYLRALGELDFNQNRLIDAVEAFDIFLAEHLLWVRSAPPPSIDMMLAVPSEIYQLLAPGHWLEVSQILLSRLKQSPVMFLALLVSVFLLIKYRLLHEKLLRTGKKVIKARNDEFGYTLKALALTLLMAAPWPLLTGITGWQLSSSPQGTDFSKALSHGLILLSPAFFYLKSFRTMCLPGGLAQVHFRWPESSTKALRYQLRILMLTFLPAGLVAITITRFSSAEFGSGLGRLAFVVLVMALAYFFYRLFSPNQTTLQDVLERNPTSALARFRMLWLVLALLLPVFLAVLAVLGFLYTAGILTGSLVETLWLLLGLIVIHQMAVRWLLMTRRKLAFEAAIERRRVALKAGEAAEAAQQSGEAVSVESSQHQVEEPEIDLFALSDESRKLLNTALPLLSLVGLWFIWSDILPAFGWLDTISLWHYTGTAGDQELLIPVTLRDFLLGMTILIVTMVASKRFPALLEIILLQRFKTTSGGRYAATTLARYSIASIGVLLALSIIGARWSQVQWLAAALSVGIGFGLQEIVANFISGLIILFERPIRVGDVVTIGDTDGVVTRIQIRATTIRSWDRLELLVPNKEFITGRLLNWTLSDQTTRLRIPVGIAYDSDVKKAMALMNEAAVENDAVLDDPEPSVVFEAFGDSTLQLMLRCFVGLQDDRMPTLTALHEAINDKFHEAGIVMAFPQRDVHLNTSQALDVRIKRD